LSDSGENKLSGDGWQSFHARFMQLAREEQGRADAITQGKVLCSMYQVLRATCSYRKHPEGWEKGKPEQGLVCLLDTPPYGVWNYDDGGVSENFLERARLCVGEAGRALPDYPKGTDAEDYWLHRLYLDLVENKSDQLFAVSKEGGMILSVCVASATFCSRLQRAALENEHLGKRQEVASNSTEAPKPAAGELTEREDKIWRVIQRGVKGSEYCRELGNAGVAPRKSGIWKDCPRKYASAYLEGEPWRHRIQDEKSRIRRKAELAGLAKLASE
jgi:hypothetical protein